jgi:trehalose 6-phosphate phosphatase
VEKDPLRPFVEDPESSGLFFDFDGVLSDIVEKPFDARPAERAREALGALADRFKLVAVVSGRSAAELLVWLGDEIEIWGIHGAQRTFEGAVLLSERAEPYSELMERVRADAEQRVAELAIEGALVEDKGVMFTIHYRAVRDRTAAKRVLEEMAEELAAGYGVVASPQKMAIELRPPVEFAKSQVILQRAREATLTAVAFVGDDVVDLPGFDALDTLAGEGVTTFKVAVDSDEAPPELLQRADLVLAGPAAVVTWMETLVSSVPLRG